MGLTWPPTHPSDRQGRALVSGGSPYSAETPAPTAAAAPLPSSASFVLKQKMSHGHREAGPQLSSDAPPTRPGANVSQLCLVCLRVTCTIIFKKS